MIFLLIERMLYIFIINGRQDKKDRIDSDLERQLDGVQIDYEKYYTTGIGDGIRYVRIYCDLHPEDEVCFVACGGSGTVNEVASGIVGFKNKSMAILAYGATNDFIKYYPEHDFTSLKGIIEGEIAQIDIIRVNDNYALNVVNLGFDSMVAREGNLLIESGMEGTQAFRKAVFRSLFGSRVNHIKVEADGKPLNRRRLLLCTMANAKWCGGQFLCAPNAVVDDGLIEVCLFKTCSLVSFLIMMKEYTAGNHLTDRFCKKRLVYCRAERVKVTSKNLMYISLDGEVIAATKYDIDIIPKAITLVLPSKIKSDE